VTLRLPFASKKAFSAGGRGCTGPGNTGPTCFTSGGSAYGSCSAACRGANGKAVWVGRSKHKPHMFHQRGRCSARCCVGQSRPV